MKQTLKFGKEQRLRGRSAIQALFGEGRGGFVYPLRYIVAVGGGTGVQVLVSVPKKLHRRAVARNFLKRRMREAYRLQGAGLRSQAAGADVGVRLALIYAAKDVVDYKIVGDAVGRILENVARTLPEPAL